MLMEVPHVGPVKATELYDLNGIRSIDDLKIRKDDVLVHAQILGLEWLVDLKQRIPRAEMDEWNDILTKMDPNGVTVGSYRRGKEMCGDIDFMTSGKPIDLQQILTKITCHSDIEIIGCFGKGITQWQGIAKLKNGIARHLDIFCYKPEVYPWALLHATGSDNFNKLCRKTALAKGLTMSQYGVKRTTVKGITSQTEVPTCRTENDILQYLFNEYTEPNQR